MDKKSLIGLGLIAVILISWLALTGPSKEQIARNKQIKDSVELANKAVELAEKENIKLSIVHQLWIKPFKVENSWKIALDNSIFGGLVTDDDYVEGTASSIANELSLATGKRVWTLGLEPKTAGFHPSVDNLPPTAEKIIEKLKNIKYGI